MGQRPHCGHALGRHGRARLIAAAVALAAWFAAIRTACPTVAHDDSGEFVVAALELGVAHPPGYALSTLVHALALHLPLGSPAFRLTLVSAASASVAAAALYRLVGGLGGIPRGVAASSAVTAALALVPWSQATTVKGGVYLAVSALLAGGVAQGIRSGPSGRRPALMGLAAGLALALHWMTAVTFLPGLWILGMGGPRLTRTRRAVVAIIGAVPALSLVLVLPLCASRAPFLNWGDPVTADRLAFVVARSQYAGRMAGPAYLPATGPQRLAAMRDAVADAGPAPVLLAAWCLGLAALARSRLRVAAGLAACVTGMAAALHTHGPLRADSPWYVGIYAIPALQLLVAVAVAAPVLAATAAGPRWRQAGIAGAAALALGCLSGVAERSRVADRSREFFTWDLADLLDRASTGPRPSLLFAGSDPVVFGNWYRWRVEARRAGAVVVPVPLLPMPWLGASFAEAVPGLRVPVIPPRTGAEAVPALLRAWGDGNAGRFVGYMFITDVVREAWPAPARFVERGPVYRLGGPREPGAGTAARAFRARGVVDGLLRREPRRMAAIQPLLFSCLHAIGTGTVAAGGESDRAFRVLRLAEAVCRSDEDRAAVALALGNLAARDRRLPEAAARYEAAARLRPGHPGALRNLAMIQLSLGLRTEALRTARRLREAAPASPEAAELAPLIRSLEPRAPEGR